MEKTKIPGRYRLIEEVGQGGMAVVFRAQDETLKREVAVKLLHQHLAADTESKARLEREAQAVAKLRHENILEIFDYSGIASESAFIVTEFIDGKTLKQLFEARAIRHPEVAALIAAEIGGASLRTFERLFVEETGLSLAAWRRNSCLLTSLSLLAQGKSIGEVAHAVGYESAAAFSTAFKQCFGVSPSSYG